MKSRVVAAAILALGLPAVVAADAMKENDSKGKEALYYPALTAGDRLPCPNYAGNVALVLYFMKDGSVRLSDACPGTTERAPKEEPPVRDRMEVEYLRDPADPCYKFVSGGRLYYRCW